MHKKSVSSLVSRLSTWHCPRLLVGRAPAAHLPLSTDISCPHGAQQQAHRTTDGQTDAQPSHKTCCAYHAGSVSNGKGKGSPYSITVRRVPQLIPVLDSQPAGDVSHKPGCRLPILSARPAVTPATLKRAATSFAGW